ncbi:hypothetical protein NLI96_g2509 [Meripilus lineatus]|uniref:Uncharacterized protein n=1 Tax=Meripilus lineatus TaxID=2056292 RepID=A0AAD5V8H2_9APHY|nr:hypothetical protein NLI96_g2509 [Physisporinus lineatus]
MTSLEETVLEAEYDMVMIRAFASGSSDDLASIAQFAFGLRDEPVSPLRERDLLHSTALSCKALSEEIILEWDEVANMDYDMLEPVDPVVSDPSEIVM